MHKQKIAIAGCTGRMGRTLIEATHADDSLELAAAFDRPGSRFVGRDAGDALGIETGVLITDDAEAAIAAADCVIDFTLPDGTLRHLDIAAARGVAAVIGTTGLDGQQKARVAEAAERVPVVFAPNMAGGPRACCLTHCVSASA